MTTQQALDLLRKVFTAQASHHIRNLKAVARANRLRCCGEAARVFATVEGDA